MPKAVHQNPNVKKLGKQPKEKSNAPTKKKTKQSTSNVESTKKIFVPKRFQKEKSVKLTTPVLKRLNMLNMGHRGSWNDRFDKKTEKTVEGVNSFLNRFTERLLTRIFEDCAAAVTYSKSGVTIQPRHVQYVAKRFGQENLILTSV